MNLSWLFTFLSLFYNLQSPTTATDTDDLKNPDTLDPKSNPDVYNPGSSLLSQHKGFKHIRPDLLIVSQDCIPPFEFNPVNTHCYINKESNFFKNKILYKGCMYGTTPEKRCSPFDIEKTCEWMKEHLEKYNHADCSNGIGNVCIYDKKPDAQTVRRITHLNDFFSTRHTNYILSSTHLDVYLHKDLKDFVRLQEVWRLLMIKFTLFVEYFTSATKDFNDTYQFQVEKWCMLKVITDYYINHNEFSSQTNILKFTRNDIQNAYKNIKERFIPESVKNLILIFEENKDRYLPTESEFKIMLLDPQDKRSLNLNSCFDTKEDE